MIPLDSLAQTSRVSQWMRAAREHHEGLYLHSLLVGELTAAFSAYLGFAPFDRRRLTIAALLHDIGKLRIDPNILDKPAALSPSEVILLCAHPSQGHSMLSSEATYDDLILTVIQNHHERLDGSGYPKGLRGSAVPEPVRIVMLCDIFAAMTEPRPYVRPVDWQTAVALIARKQTRVDQR